MIFKSGDLVTANFSFGDVYLWATPPKPTDNKRDEPVGVLKSAGVALVIAISGLGGLSTYIVGSTGSGWALSAFLRRI